MRLAEGDVDGAVRAARRMLDEHGTGPARSALLAAAVEVRLAAGDMAGARQLADELATLAAAMGTEMVRSVGPSTRAGPSCWPRATRRRRSPRCGPRARPGATCRCRTRWPGRASSSALAYRAVGDDDAADLELDGARATFESLGATVDLARIESRRRPSRAASPSGSARCCGSSPRARPTARSPPSW